MAVVDSRRLRPLSSAGEEVGERVEEGDSIMMPTTIAPKVATFSSARAPTAHHRYVMLFWKLRDMKRPFFKLSVSSMRSARAAGAGPRLRGLGTPYRLHTPSYDAKQEKKNLLRSGETPEVLHAA